MGGERRRERRDEEGGAIVFLEGRRRDLNRAHWQRICHFSVVFVIRESKKLLELHE